MNITLQKELLKRFSKYINPYIKDEIILFILIILSSLGSLAMPYILKVIIDDIFPKGAYTDLLVVLFFLIGITALQIVFSMVSDVMSIKISKKIASDIREDVFKNILSKDLSFFKNAKVGEIVFTLMNDVDNIQQVISSLLIRSAKNILVLVGVTVMLFILDYKLAFISIGFIPLVILILKMFTPHVKNNFVEIQQMEGDLNNYLVEKIKNIRVIKSYSTFKVEIKSLKKRHNAIISKYSRGVFISTLNTSISAFVMTLASITVLLYGGYHVFQGAMSIGVLIAFIQYLNRLFTPTIEIVTTSNQFAKSIISMKRVSSYFNDENFEEEVSSERNEVEEIAFNNVSLDFEGVKVIKNINITFRQGNTYVLYGNSGSGKSSIINLLCDFITPSSGTITINSEMIKKCFFWKNEFCLIEKENQIFHDSLQNNIKYGYDNSKFSIDEIIKLVQLEDVVSKLESGVETIVSLNGGTMSDGQKQRISIGRAINKAPSVFIFDESTSSLDGELEKEIVGKIRYLFPKSIIIIISHRIETFALADYIYKMHNCKLDQQHLLSAVV